MNISRRNARQHIFGVVYQIDFFEDFEVQKHLNTYLLTLAINQTEGEIISEETENLVDIEEFDIETETDNEIEIETNINTKNDVRLEKYERNPFEFDNEFDFEGIKRKVINNEAYEYIYNTISGTYQNLSTIDEYISKNSKWSIDRLSKEVKAVLRIAIYEFLFCKDISHKVIINEAVELAKKYCDEDTFKFVNGLLGKVSKTLES
ncbi:MAG: transcription antitermination factor NusB [Lachnospirales bacterium]